MAISKVVYDGNTLIDLTNDTVTADTLTSGVTAHNAAGVSITGTASYLPTSGGTITGDLTVNGHIYPADSTTLIASGSMTGGSSPWYISGGFNGAVYKNLLIALRVRQYSGSNLYITYTFPSIADVWGLYIPYASDFYRAAVTITGSGEDMGMLLQIDSSGFSTTAYVYAML